MLLSKTTPRGFGLIEQIVVLIVLAIITAFAIPAFSRMLDGHELRTAQTDFLAALQHARNLAVNGQTNVVLCPSRDALRCSGDSDWSRGWVVGLDQGKGDLKGDPLYAGSGGFTRLHIVGSDSKRNVRFYADGTTTSNQTLYFCVRGNNPEALIVVISRLGRVRGGSASSADAEKCAADD